MKNKILSLIMAVMLILMTVGCGGSSGTSPTPKKKGDTVTSGQDTGVPDEVKEPITVELWHTFGSGQQAEYMQYAIDTFNKTNDKGITVVGNYIGGYVALRTSLSIAIGAGENPQMAVLGMSPILASNHVLADMKPYAERDNFDLDNIFKEMKGTMYYEDALVSLPLLRSSILFCYNVDMWKNAGFDAPPTNIKELEEQCAAVAKKNNTYGFEMLIDPSYYQESLICSMGGQGIVDSDTMSSSCLDDGTMLTMLSDWKRWVDEGWCRKPSVTNAPNEMQQAFYTGKLASGLFSSGVLSALVTNAEDAGIEVGATIMPGYDGQYAASGGGDISIISKNNSQQQIAACWEFIKFLFTDEQVAQRHIQTGYLPVTSTAIESETLKSFWEENPIYSVAYKYRENCIDPTGSIYRSEWNTQVGQAISYVIQDNSKTPEEAIEYLKQMYPTVFPK